MHFLWSSVGDSSAEWLGVSTVRFSTGRSGARASELMKVLEVDWLDSVGNGRWSQKSDHLATREELMHRSVGYFLDEDDDRLVIVQSYGEANESFNNSMAIPKVSILKRRELRR